MGRAKALQNYLQDYVDLNPELSSQLRPKDEVLVWQELEDSRARTAELKQLLVAKTRECDELRRTLSGLRTPSKFEVEQQILDKLEPLERQRLLEAVQAYRVNAWTPAAAVCGMLLEGRLQTLCHANNIRPGGMSDMVRRLGEAGLLKGYYQELARVGTFFRHRAAHPTDEEFDREKTTLVLTALIILIRDQF